MAAEAASGVLDARAPSQAPRRQAASQPGSSRPIQAVPAPRDTGTLKSVTAALDVLDCFANDDELGVSDIARRLGVAKSTAHRLLAALCTRGLTEKNPETGQYRLGLHLFELGQLSLTRMRLRNAALPLLEEMRQISGYTIHLAVPDGSDVVYLERLESRRSRTLFSDVARRWPVHSTSSGKAIAAFDPTVAEARRVAGFPAYTTTTLRSAAEWDRMLAETRRQRVAISRGEAKVGLSSVAAPVCDSSGRARAAISVVAPAADLNDDLGRPARLVQAMSARLARILAI